MVEPGPAEHSFLVAFVGYLILLAIFSYFGEPRLRNWLGRSLGVSIHLGWGASGDWVVEWPVGSRKSFRVRLVIVAVKLAVALCLGLPILALLALYHWIR